MTSAGNVPRTVRVLLDGHPISVADSGADVHGGLVTVSGQRLYGLISLPGAQQHTFTLQIPPGVSAYDFTSETTAARYGAASARPIAREYGSVLAPS